MSDTSRTCGDCKYERGGTCHRFPPIIHFDAGTRCTWPEVLASDWCGEFAIRPHAGEPGQGAGRQGLMGAME